MPGDHKDKKKKKIEDIRDRLAKISKKVPQDRIPRSPNEDNNFQTRIDKPIEQRALKEKVKKSKKYKTHAERDTEKHGEGLYEMMDRFGEIEKKKPKQKKAELTDVTKEHKQKQKKKDKLIHEARGTGVIPTYSKSKVKKTPPQGPNPNAETADDILKNAEVVSRKNDTYIGQLKQKIAEKRKRDYQQFKLKEEEEEEEKRKEHHHNIEFKGHTGQYYKRASLVSASGKYAKYWLLNAKQTNGNGWGVSQQSIAKNIHKFIGRPLVVTAKSWVPDSAYGDQFEHPYLPTNDINKVLDHQERYRVGSIVDIIEKDGDYFANIEINQKFANMILPPFCSPAIFQNNPAEPEGQISDWEALHLAALMEDPAYGSRIALLRGTCVGTKNECTVQFKSAKKEAKMVCTKGLKERLARVKKNEKTSDQAIDDVIKDIKDPDLREDAETRHHHTRPKRLYNYNKKAKLKQRLALVRKQNKPIGPLGYRESVDMEGAKPSEGGSLLGVPTSKLEGTAKPSEGVRQLLTHPYDEAPASEFSQSLRNDPRPEQDSDIYRDALDNMLEDRITKHGDVYYKKPKKFYEDKKALEQKTDIDSHVKGRDAPYNIIKPEKLDEFIDDLIKNRDPETVNKWQITHMNQPSGARLDDANIAGYSRENAIKWSKLKQRIAAIEQQKLAVSYKRKIDEVMKSFNTWEYKNEKTPKGLKKKDDRFEPLFTKHKGGIRGVRHLGNKFQYSGHYKGTGTTIPKGAKDKFIPHIIMEKTPKGIIVDNYGYDTGSTYRYWNKAGISTERKGDKMYVGGKPYDFEQGGKMLIPYKNITAPLAPKKRYVGPVRPRQHEMSQQTRLDATGDIKGVPEDPTRIQPRDQRLINKITGVKSKVPRRKILGTESHHLFEYSKYPQMDKLKNIGVGVSHRTHQEMMNPRKFTAKLKQRLSKISGMPKDNKWVYDSIDDPYMSTEIAEHRELEYPVIKWNKGEEYAVLSNKSGKPLQDNKFSTKNPPKNIEYLQQFNNPEDALDYSEYKHTKEYGPHLFENDEHFKGLEKKFKHIKDPNTQYQ